MADVVETADAEISKWPTRPTFSIILLPGAPGFAASMADALRSVEGQCYGEWEILSFLRGGDDAWAQTSNGPQRRLFLEASDAAQALNIAIREARADYLLPLAAGDRLPPAALFRYAQALQRYPDQQILFGDEDQIDGQGKRFDPWFKPQWNSDMFLAQDYVSRACVIRTDLARALVPVETDTSDCSVYALLLQTDGTSSPPPKHVPHILCHRSGADGPEMRFARLRAVARHLAGTGAKIHSARFDAIDIDWPMPDPPPAVSIVIPTRDRKDILRQCIDSVLEKTNYPNFELIVVDNDSTEPGTLDYLRRIAEDPRIRVMTHEGPFNYSAINNAAIRRATGDYICLLNNDTEVIAPGWLTAMIRQAARPTSGAVGAKLLYPDGRIQHAGVVIGMGGAAGHAHRFADNESAGYFAQAHIQRWASAVTAACLVVKKAKFEAVGGLDERELAVAFNDVDLCLKLEKMDWHNIYEPRALLYHHESQSRGSDLARGQVERYRRELGVLQARWGTDRYVDPLHHPALDCSGETYFLRV